MRKCQKSVVSFERRMDMNLQLRRMQKIGSALLALLLGWNIGIMPAEAAEQEETPIAITAKHFPDAVFRDYVSNERRLPVFGRNSANQFHFSDRGRICGTRGLDRNLLLFQSDAPKLYRYKFKGTGSFSEQNAGDFELYGKSDCILDVAGDNHSAFCGLQQQPAYRVAAVW